MLCISYTGIQCIGYAGYNVSVTPVCYLLVALAYNVSVVLVYYVSESYICGLCDQHSPFICSILTLISMLHS